MKGNRKYIVLIGLAVALIVFLQSLAPKPINWQPTYSKRDKIPYGGYVLYELLSGIFKGATVTTVQEPAYSVLTARSSDEDNATYMLINGELSPDEYDTEQLLTFVRDGSTAFIAAESLTGNLADSLHLEIETHWDYSNDSMGINFANPHLRRSNDYQFKSSQAGHYFSGFDSVHTTILGTNERGDVNYIRIHYGDGEFYINTIPDAFTNYSLVNRSVQNYAITALSYLPLKDILWDEYYKVGRRGAKTPLRFILGADSLRWAYYLLIVTILLYVIFEGKRRQRIIPEIPPVKNTTLEFVDTVGRLYYQHGDHRNIAEKKIAYLFEYIRSNFHEPTRVIDENFYHRLAERSGIEQERIVELFRSVQSILNSTKTTETELIRLNTLIENFYTESKR